MKIVVCGGGKIGFNVVRALISKKNEVSLIEKDRSKCLGLANDLSASVYGGDCTDIETLRAAGAMKCDCFIALTGVDQDNLVASQLARNYFEAKKVIARVNDPRNINTFHYLGIDQTVSSTEIITSLIEQEASLSSAKLVASLGKGKAEVVSAVLPKKSIYEGKRLKEIRFPKGVLIISATHEGDFQVPNGDTMLMPGDEIIAVCTRKVVNEFSKRISETVK